MKDLSALTKEEKLVDALLWNMAEMNRYFPSDNPLSALMNRCLSRLDLDALCEDELSHIAAAAGTPEFFDPFDHQT